MSVRGMRACGSGAEYEMRLTTDAAKWKKYHRRLAEMDLEWQREECRS